jgi:tetratricopeptide (TPR) repeat protein
MKLRTLIIILSFLSAVYGMGEADSLLLKGDEYYYKGDLETALDLYFQAESVDPSNLCAKEGIYNASINSGGIKTANNYAYKLLKIRNSQLNQDRVIYSDALLGKTSGAEKFLKVEKDFFRRKAIYSMAGSGLVQTGYYMKTAEWYKKALDAGFKSDEFKNAYRKSSELIYDDKKYMDIIFSLYDYSGNDLLESGYNFNLNYNFGPRQHKFNLNLVLQGTAINKDLNESLGFLFYEDINQFELFGQYNYYMSGKTSFYTGIKTGWLINDYIQDVFSASAGCRFSITDYFRANTFFNVSGLTYNTYTFNTLVKQGGGYLGGSDYTKHQSTMTSLQFTIDGAFTFRGIYLGGVVNIVQEPGSGYAEDMEISDRDTLLTTISENIASGDVRLLYGITAGYNNGEYDVFSSFTTGDMFLVNTGEGRYLNTNDSKLKSNILGGVIFKKLFGDWILGYTFSYSDFDDYKIMTNSIIANYKWR